ncbi:hypothetical protein Tco_0608161 [Tanacetum coccineum]
MGRVWIRSWAGSGSGLGPPRGMPRGSTCVHVAFTWKSTIIPKQNGTRDLEGETLRNPQDHFAYRAMSVIIYGINSIYAIFVQVQGTNDVCFSTYQKSLALKAKKESSDEECSTSRSEDEEYAMEVRDFKKFFKRRGRFVKQPQNDKKTFQRSRDDKNDDKKVNNEMRLVAQASSDVCSESSYFSDENSSIDDVVLNNEYDKLCKMSLKIITKNKRLKAIRDSLEKKISILKEKVSTLEKNKGVDLECVKCHMLKIENEKLKEEALKLTKFEKSTHCLNEMLNNQKPSGEKLGLRFNSFEESSSGTKEIKFVKA